MHLSLFLNKKNGNLPFLHTIQTLQFIYTTRHYTHYIVMFLSEYIYLCIELIPISHITTYEMVMNFDGVIYHCCLEIGIFDLNQKK